MSNKLNILIVAGEMVLPLRSSIRDMIYCFRHHPNCNAFFYFTEQGPFPSYLKKVDFDLVVFTDTFAGERWKGKEQVEKYVYRPLEYLRNLNTVKVIHPQDEWIYTNLLNEMISHFNITHVFSCAPQNEWKKIYDKIDHAKIKFSHVLTGYLEDHTLTKIEKITQETQKKIDIGYRAVKAPPWLGRHGYLKTQIADAFNSKAPAHGFKTDISTEEKDTISGDNWFSFLASCKYFIGVEGGSTIIDRDGDIWKKGNEFVELNPKAGFEEFEKACFPGMDGNLGLIALSPRHLEACATKTCQVLIEGKYNNILKPGIHYIEVKKDFSNLDEVFSKMKDEGLRKKIVEKAYEDIVKSGKYSYRGYTGHIIKTSLEGSDIKPKLNAINRLNLLRNRLSERRFWNTKKAQTKHVLAAS
jgi:hypothetical protein